MALHAVKADLVEIARRELAAGRIERRDFLKLALWAGVAPAALGLGPLTGREATAQAKEIVAANFGGDAVKFMGEAWGEPYTKDTGVKVTFDGASPLPGKIKAMVESGKVTWDACDADGFVGAQLGPNVLEPIDYSVVNKSMLRPGWDWKYAMGSYSYSFVLAYDKTKFPNKPPTYADFFDTKKYPGKRALWKYMMGAVEACLLGDGVPVNKLYPLDMDRAIKKVKTLGKDVIFWSSGAESQQVFLDKEVIMANIWNTRASVLERDTKGRVTWTWNQGMFSPAAWVVPKGNPAGKEVMKWLASTLAPERQIKLLSLLGNGPSNPKASASEPKDMNRLDPGFEANLKLQFPRNEDWYEKNYDAATDKWIDGISG
ncbi:MAG: ABC transporter substrate-binding protein [Alphaproteobacteria bacterium]